MAPTRRRWRDRLPPVFSTTYIIGIRQPLVLVQCSPPPSPLIGITYTNLPVPSFRKFPTTVSYGRLYLEQCSWQMIDEKPNILDNSSYTSTSYSFLYRIIIYRYNLLFYRREKFSISNKIPANMIVVWIILLFIKRNYRNEISFLYLRV